MDMAADMHWTDTTRIHFEGDATCLVQLVAVPVAQLERSLAPLPEPAKLLLSTRHAMP